MDHYQPKKYRGIESEHKEVRAKLLQHPSGLKRFLNLSKVLSLNFLHSSLGTGPRPPQHHLPYSHGCPMGCFPEYQKSAAYEIHTWPLHQGCSPGQSHKLLVTQRILPLCFPLCTGSCISLVDPNGFFLKRCTNRGGTQGFNLPLCLRAIPWSGTCVH